MAQIQTVLGRMEAAQLGYCQMHEHLYVSEGPATQKFPALRIDNLECSCAEAADYKRAGGCSLLDAQPVYAGRNAAMLSEISRSSGVNIICVTGFHLPHFYESDSMILNAPGEELSELFLRELTQGCAEAPSVKAGAVKAALGRDGCQGRTEINFRAAAYAAARQNVPLVVHTEKGFGALKAIDIALEMGVKKNRILICHVDRQAADFAPHDEIAKTGVVLEYDTIGRFKYHDDASEIRMIAHMLEAGYGAQLLLSLDTTRERLGRYGGEISLKYIRNTFLPQLVQAGFFWETIRIFTEDNPRRVFE